MGEAAVGIGGRGTKRRRSSSDSLDEDDDGASKKGRRESTSAESSSPDTSRLDESGYQSDSSQHEMFHPAFRGTTCSTNTNSEISVAPASGSSSSTCGTATGAGAIGAVPGVGQTMEIDQITSLVSIFSFGQHIMAAAAAANSNSSNTIPITNTMPTTNSSISDSIGSSKVVPASEASEADEEEKKEKKRLRLPPLQPLNLPAPSPHLTSHVQPRRRLLSLPPPAWPQRHHPVWK